MPCFPFWRILLVRLDVKRRSSRPRIPRPFRLCVLSVAISADTELGRGWPGEIYRYIILALTCSTFGCYLFGCVVQHPLFITSTNKGLLSRLNCFRDRDAGTQAQCRQITRAGHIFGHSDLV